MLASVRLDRERHSTEECRTRDASLISKQRKHQQTGTRGGSIDFEFEKGSIFKSAYAAELALAHPSSTLIYSGFAISVHPITEPFQPENAKSNIHAYNLICPKDVRENPRILCCISFLLTMFLFARFAMFQA